MPGSFDIDTAANTIQLEQGKSMDISFTVSNPGEKAINGRASLVSENPEASNWIKIVGELERNFPSHTTEHYTIQVAPPLNTPIGTYTIRLNMIGVENPDEDFTEGPTVAITVKEPEVIVQPVVEKQGGYIATLVGAIAGALVGGTLLGIMGFLVVSGQDDLGGIIVAVILFVFLSLFAAWLGAIIGSGVALRIRNHSSSLITALILAIVLPVLFILLSTITSPLERAGDAIQNVSLIITVLLSLIGAALASRALTLLIKTGKIGKWG